MKKLKRISSRSKQNAVDDHLEDSLTRTSYASRLMWLTQSWESVYALRSMKHSKSKRAR